MNSVTVEFKQAIPILRIFDAIKAKEFYCEFLGFDAQWEHHFSDNWPAYIEVQRDGMALHLSEHRGDCTAGSAVFVWMTGIGEFQQEITSKAYSYTRLGRLLEPFLPAAIHEPNPILNRQFVDPCIESFGHRCVNEYLLDVVERGDNAEIAGAVASLYWANMQTSITGKVPTYTLEHATPESRGAFELLNDLWERKRATLLRVFVSNPNLDVRRQITPSIMLDEDCYPESLKPLVKQAIEIAKNDTAEYIRYRVEVQLGNERLLQPIPERGHLSSG